MRPRPAWPGLPPLPGIDAPFTPETCPGLSPEFRAILNTPLEDCDPEIARLLFAGFAHLIAELLPPELGLADAGAVFATLCDRLTTGFADTTSAAPPAEAPDSAPVPPTDAEPVPPPATQPDAATEPPPSLPQAHPTPSEEDTAAAAIAVSAIAPDAASPPEQDHHAGRTRPGWPLPGRETLTSIPGMTGEAEAPPPALSMAVPRSRQPMARPPPAPVIMRAGARPGRSPAFRRRVSARVATGPPTGPPFARVLQLRRA